MRVGERGELCASTATMVAMENGGSAFAAIVVDVPDYMVRDGTTYRILADHLGSVRLVVDAAAGAVVQEIAYDEFGVATLLQGTWDFQPFGFAGGLYDADTGLVRFGVRDYEAVVGRWTAKDPILIAAALTCFAVLGITLYDPQWVVRFLNLRLK